MILNLLCEVASANGISTDDVPKGENKQKTKQQEDGKKKRGGTENNKEEKQVRKKASKEASKETCKPNAKDARKDDSDDGDNQPLSKRVRLAGYRTKSSQTGQVAAISTSKDIKTPSDKGKQVHTPEFIAEQSLRLMMEIVKELDVGVDIDLNGIGFIETRKSSSKSETVNPSSMTKIREVPSKESNQDS